MAPLSILVMMEFFLFFTSTPMSDAKQLTSLRGPERKACDSSMSRKCEDYCSKWKWPYETCDEISDTCYAQMGCTCQEDAGRRKVMDFEGINGEIKAEPFCERSVANECEDFCKGIKYPDFFCAQWGQPGNAGAIHYCFCRAYNE